MRAAPGAEGLGPGRPSDPMRFSHVSMTSFKFGNDATISIRPLGTHNTVPNILTFYNSISNPERPSLLCAALPHCSFSDLSSPSQHLWTSVSRHPASSATQYLQNTRHDAKGVRSPHTPQAARHFCYPQPRSQLQLESRATLSCFAQHCLTLLAQRVVSDV